MSRATSKTLLAACLLGLLPAAMAAQSDVERTVDARPDGRVLITNIAGSVVVSGWDRNEVEVRGNLGRGVEKLDVDASGGTVEIEVDYYRNSRGRDADADLEIRVPVGSDLDVEAVSASVEVSGLEGEVAVESVSGSVDVEGRPRSVDVESVSGAIEVRGQAEEVSVESVSGRIRLSGAFRDVEAGSVSGRIELRGEELRRADLSTTSGDIELSSSLAPGAEIEADSHSGSVELLLPPSTSARFEVTTYSGRIDNDLGPPAEKTSRYSPGKELEFSLGGGDAEIQIETFSGSVRLKQR